MSPTKNIEKNINALYNRVQKSKRSINKEVAELLKRGIVRVAPVSRRRGRRGGTLKRSIRVYQDGDTAIIAPDTTARAYAGFVRYGTSKLRSNDFMTKGFNNKKAAAQRHLKALYTSTIENK